MKYLIAIRAAIMSITVCLLLMLSGSSVHAQMECYAYFTWSQDANFVSLYALSDSVTNQPATYNWTLPNGDNSVGEEASFGILAGTADYVVCMSMVTADGCTDSDCQTLTLTYDGEPTDTLSCNPFFEFEIDQLANQSWQVTYFADAPGNVISHNWELNGLPAGQEQAGSYDIAYPGQYALCLYVTTLDGCTGHQCQEFVIDSGDFPADSTCYAAFSTSVNPNGVITAISNSYSESDTTLYSWFVNQDPYGMGAEIDIITDLASIELCLLIQTDDGCQDQACETVQVGTNNCEPWIDYTWDDTGLIYTFYGGTYSDLPAQEVVWTFYDGTTTSGEVVDHQFPSAGVYEICLEVTTVTGCMSSFCYEIDVQGGESGNNGWIPGDSSQWVLPMDTLFVWPGDANNDGVANNLDVLYVGLGYDVQGPDRYGASTDWNGQFLIEWPYQFLDGINMAYADCDGDGAIQQDDLLVVELNYGQTHGKTGGSEEATADDPGLYVQLPTESLDNGDELIAPLVFGSTDVSVESIYGIAFTLEYNPLLIDPTTVQLNFTDSWMGASDEVLTLTKSFPQDGKIEAAICSNTHMDMSGFGSIANLSGIIDNIAGKVETDFQITVSNVTAITTQNEEIIINTEPQSTGVINDATDIQSAINNIEVYPNPAQDALYLNGLPANSSVIIRDMQGRIFIEELLPETSATVNLEELNNGLYLVSLLTDEGTSTVKLQIID